VNPKQTSGETFGLTFFGRMVASISHEIKNSLAIIDGNAGLLGDYMHLMEKGRAVNPDRIVVLTGKIADHIHRADGLVQNLNQFAHSADLPRTQIDLCRLVELMTNITVRMAASHWATVSARLPEQPVPVYTGAFLLLRLLIHCLEYMLKAEDEPRNIEVQVQQYAEEAVIKLSGAKGLHDSETLFSADGHVIDMLRELEASLLVDPDAGTISIQLPNGSAERQGDQ
jgi:C4-dicarboxylate-specific signal transduction histidine kinase